MHIDDLLDSYLPVYPENGNWDETFKILREDPHEWDTVQKLVAILNNEGAFRDPIVLDKSDTDGSGYVSDGTHRVFAHTLSEVKMVKVAEASDAPTNNDEHQPYLVTVFILDGNWSDELFDAMFSPLRSFPISDSLWANSDLMSSNGKNLYVYWYLGHGMTVEELEACAPGIEQKTLSVCENNGIAPKVQTMLIRTEAEEDAFFSRDAS